MDVADSRSSKSSMGGIDGPCSPCTLTKMNRTHKQMNRCNKLSPTKIIDGLAAGFADVLALSGCFVAIMNVRNFCVVFWKKSRKKVLLKC